LAKKKGTGRKRRPISAEGRRAVSLAAKRRWAKYRAKRKKKVVRRKSSQRRGEHRELAPRLLGPQHASCRFEDPFHADAFARPLLWLLSLPAALARRSISARSPARRLQERRAQGRQARRSSDRDLGIDLDAQERTTFSLVERPSIVAETKSVLDRAADDPDVAAIPCASTRRAARYPQRHALPRGQGGKRQQKPVYAFLNGHEHVGRLLSRDGGRPRGRASGSD
jgi:hypothetical protein